MHINELLDRNVVADLKGEGWLNEQTHPTEPLAILNYSPTAQVAGAAELWDHPYYGETIRQCRGLIYRTDTGEVVATPFPKFFNYGQAGADTFELDDEVLVLDKVDGSLGILYREPSTELFAIATRGSFTSEQAVHATNLLRTKYANWYPKIDRWTHPGAEPVQDTLLFEIVYPENRIVLDYGDQDDLVLLGSIHIEHGWISSPRAAKLDHYWPGPIAHHFGGMTLAEVLARPDRPNAEGYVLISATEEYSAKRRMVKIKQEDYKALHAAMWGINQRGVYNAIMRSFGGPEIQYGLLDFDGLLAAVPDEFQDWVKDQARELRSRVVLESDKIREEYRLIMDQTVWETPKAPVGHRQRAWRKQFASIVKGDPHQGYYWLLFDGQGEKVDAELWRTLKINGKINPINTRQGKEV